MGFQLVPAATKVLYSNAVQHLQSLNPDTGDPKMITMVIIIINCLLIADLMFCQYYLQNLLLPDWKKKPSEVGIPQNVHVLMQWNLDLSPNL